MATPWRTIDSIDTDEGLLDLRQRGETDFLITIAGRVLMNSSSNVSEIVLAQRACAPMKKRNAPRVLVGGLGMGFTLKSALDNLPANASVVVAELNPVVVDWCRGPMAHVAGGAVDDPRVEVVVDDVASVIRRAASVGGGRRFDAIILDLYEGPNERTRDQGAHLYGGKALASTRSALTADGVLAVWSEEPDKAFEKRLDAAGFKVSCQRPGRGSRHAVYIAKKLSGLPRQHRQPLALALQIGT